MSVDALHEHTANLVCLEAVWPAYPIVHDVVAAASSGSALWTAGRAGSIIRWAQPDRSGAWEPAVLCCGHSAPVHTLLSCTAGQPALLSVDEQGGICLWEEATGICNHRAVLPIRPGAKAVAFTSGEHVCLHCQSGADASAAAGDHALAVVQAGSLAVVAMVMPAAMQSLARFFEQGPFLGGQEEAHMLALHAVSLGRKGTAVLGITQQGSVFTWQLGHTYAPAGASRPVPASPTRSASPRFGSSATPPSQDSTKLEGALLAADFGDNGGLLLLVTATGWLLLAARMHDAETPGHFTQELCSSGSRTRIATSVDGRSAMHCQLSDQQGPAADGPAHNRQAGSAGRQFTGGCILHCGPGENASQPGVTLLLSCRDSSALVVAVTRDGCWVPLADLPPVFEPAPRPDAATACQYLSLPHGQVASISSINSLDPAGQGPAPDVCVRMFAVSEPASRQREHPLHSNGIVQLGSSESASATARHQHAPVPCLRPICQSFLSSVWGLEPPSSVAATHAGGHDTAAAVVQLSNGHAQHGGFGHPSHASRSWQPQSHGAHNQPATASGACHLPDKARPVNGHASGLGFRDTVTAFATVGGDALAPAFCVQGFSSGAVVLTPLAICSMAHQLTCLRHTAAAPPAYVLGSHYGSVLCFMEQTYTPGNGLLRRVLLSGGADGSLCGWDLDSDPPGNALFSLCVHTAAVTHMLPPPETAPLPWSCCIASIGADGTVCIVSLITLRCERVLPGHPPGSPYHIFWDPTLGYMACMCSDPEGPAGPGLSDQGHEPLLILWDIHAGRQDRVVQGQAAISVMNNLAAVSSSRPSQRARQQPKPNSKAQPARQLVRLSACHASIQSDASQSTAPTAAAAPSSSRPASPMPFDGPSNLPAAGQGERPHSSPSTPAGSMAPPPTPTAAVANYLPAAVHLVEVDIRGLLVMPPVLAAQPAAPASETAPPMHPFASGSPKRAVQKAGITKSSGRGGEVAALALALAMLHLWGLDDSTDQQLYNMLVDVGLVPSPPSNPAPAGSPGPFGPSHAQCGSPRGSPQSAVAVSGVCGDSPLGRGAGSSPFASGPSGSSPAELAGQTGSHRVAGTPGTPTRSGSPVRGGSPRKHQQQPLRPLPWGPSVALVQGAVVGAAGAVTLQFPSRPVAQAAQQPQLGSHQQRGQQGQQNPGDQAAEDPASSEPVAGPGHDGSRQNDLVEESSQGVGPNHQPLQAPGHQQPRHHHQHQHNHQHAQPAARQGYSLWHSSRSFLAARLLATIALSKRLMGRGPMTERLCNGCSVVVAFYAVRLRELLPKLPVPDLPLWGSLWQETNDSLREAARALLAAATDPAAYGLRGAVPYEAMAIIIRTGLSPTQLQPQQMLDLTLQVADDAAWPPHQLIVAGAACVYHARDMPEELLARVVPQLVGLVCGPPGPHSSAAASVMAEGLTGPSAVRWKQHLSDLTALIQKVLAVCERLGAVAAGPLTSSAPPTKQAPRRLPSTRTIGRTVSLTLASAGYSAAKVAAAGSVTSMSMRDLSQAAPQAEASASASKPQLKSAELMKCRDSVASLLPALAAIDLRMFLHLMGHRMTGGCVGESPSHLMCLMALVRLMHSRGGLAQVAAHLPLLITVVLKGLDPVFPALRRTCLQGVMAVVKEVCMRFPMVTFTVAVNPMLLAVGCAPSQDQAMPAVGGSHLDVGEPIAVYDMDTGAKKRALHFRADGPTRVRQASEAISAAAFNASGDSLAAFTAADSCVRIWPLVAAWTQRLQRGPAVLLPTARLSVPPLAQGPRPLKGGSAVDLGYHVVWETDSRVAVVYHGQRVTVNVPV